MREFLRCLLFGERRKKKVTVVVERRQRVAFRAADQKLYESIDRLALAVERRRVQK